MKSVYWIKKTMINLIVYYFCFNFLMTISLWLFLLSAYMYNCPAHGVIPVNKFLISFSFQTPYAFFLLST